MTNPKIGFIGVGTMGRGMINNLKKTYDVTVYNRTRARAEALGGVSVAGSPGEAAAAADIIFTCVSNDTALTEVLFGDKGIFSVELKGKTLVDSSTTSLELTEKIKKQADGKGAKFLDAPITGSKLGAEGGTMMFMVGGEKNIFDGLLPVLETMGKRFVYCGESGNGQRAKHALNLTMSMILESYLEGMALGIKHGVPADAMQEILDNSGAQNAVATFKMPYIKKRDFDQHFMLKLMHKDLKLAEADRRALGLYAPLSDAITGVFGKALPRGDEDIATIAKTLEQKNDISFS